LRESNRFGALDGIIPMPMFRSKEKQRGYNQAEVIAKGVAAVMGLPVMPHLLVRRRLTETQTRKHRTERWQNVEGSFVTPHPDHLSGKHLLLVDDVITTGASIEAAGRVMAVLPDVRLSVASVALASKA
jgi:predicted amidophosphoribosyltransferase